MKLDMDSLPVNTDDFESQILEARQILKLFLCNRIDKAVQLITAKAAYSLYHRYALGLMIFGNVSNNQNSGCWAR